MSIGAMVGWMTVFLGADLYTGILAALIIGGVFGLMHAIFTVYLGASQHVTGIGITMLASSLGFFIFKLILPASTTPPKIKPFQPIDIPFLSDLPFFGQALFQHTPFTYLAIVAVIFAFWLMNSTPLGLSIKMAGENPMAQKMSSKQNRMLNKELMAWMRERGYGPIRIRGRFGNKERSMIIPNITREDMIEAGKYFNQESVIWGEKTAEDKFIFDKFSFFFTNFASVDESFLSL